MNEMVLPNQDKIRSFGEKETNKYLRIQKVDTIKPVEMKDTIQKDYLKRTRKLLEIKLCCWNLVEEINSYAAPS